MKSNFWKFFLITVLAFTVGCNKQKTATTQNDSSVIRIGEVETLTGSEATFGISIHQGIELAVNQINAAGGILGKKLEVVTLDDQGKSEEAATAATKLINQHQIVAIIGALASSRTMAIAPIAQKSHIPVISPTATNPKVTTMGDYIFRVCFIDAFQGSVMAKFAAQHLKAKTIAIIRDIKSDYSVGLSEIFAETFKKEGGKVVAEQSYSTGDIDYKSQLTAIRTANPDVVFIPGYYTEVGLISRQARELGIKVPLLGGDGWSSPKLKEIAGNAVNDSYYSDHYSNEDKSEKVQGFVSEFKKSHNHLPDGFAALGYDSVKILANAIAQGKSTATETIRNQLANIQDFEGITGKIRFDADRNPVKSAIVLKIENGQATYQTTIQPQ